MLESLNKIHTVQSLAKRSVFATCNNYTQQGSLRPFVFYDLETADSCDGNCGKTADRRKQANADKSSHFFGAADEDEGDVGLILSLRQFRVYLQFKNLRKDLGEYERG